MALIFDLVDDDIVHQFTSSKMIELSGLDISTNTYYNGKEALQRFDDVTESEIPDVVLLDINMPIMDAWQYLDNFKNIKSLNKKVSIFILSSSLDERDILKSKEYEEVIDYLVKPLEQDSLNHILRSIGYL